MARIYFKYFDSSELSKKRLLYNELYFASRREVNDPYDINIDRPLQGEPDQFSRLFDRIIIEMQQESRKAIKGNPRPFIDFMMNNTVSNNTIGIVNSDDFFKVLLNCFGDYEREISVNLAFHFRIKLVNFFKMHLENDVFIVSFSQRHDNLLMWSHYADAHKGFCLIYSAVNGSLYQDHRKTISVIKPSPSAQVIIPDKFEFQRVVYGNSLATLDGFAALPGGINGRPFTSKEVDKYWADFHKAFLHKAKDWEYEEEYRLLLPFRLTRPTSRFERLFYFDFSQLTGIIFGSKANTKDCDDLGDIIMIQRRQLLEVEKVLPPFVFYQAEIDYINFKIKCKPVYLLDMFNQQVPIAETKAALQTYYRTKKDSKTGKKAAHVREEMDFFNPLRNGTT